MQNTQTKNMRKSINLFLSLLFLSLTSFAQSSNPYDIVLKNGRVMDPETGLDAVRNLGIRGDRIVEITEANISGKEEIDVSGHVVAPGFIDLHVHGMTNQAHQYQARDGVTTALELESGIPFLRDWIESKRDKTIVNYGATVPHATIRALAMGSYQHYFEEAQKILKAEGIESPNLA
jgi:imidazolonepropionase-like amidohydrolase